MHILLIFRCNYQLPPLSETFVPTANWLYWIDEIMSHVLSILSNTVVFCNVIIFTIHVIWFDKMSMVNTISHLEFMYYLNLWSSLIYNKSARHKRHECDTSATLATQVQHECYTNETRATRVLHERHECDTSEKFLTLITTRLKTYFHTAIFSIWQVKNYK